jgi:transposase
VTREGFQLSKTSCGPGPAGADYEVFCGIDVARETHHAVALDLHGQRLFDRPLPNAEPDLVELFEDLEGYGRVLVVVDQLASIGALAIAVARSRGIAVAYLPGLAMRRIADVYPGETKTDARDAHVIADAARTLPHALRRVGPEEQTTVELSVLAGYDADLAAESTRLTNRLHDALLHVHPALERLLGNHFRRRGVLGLLAATGTPSSIARLGETGIKALVAAGSPRMAHTLPGQVLTALAEQSVTIPATEQYGRVIRGLARQLLIVIDQRDTLRTELQELLATHPLAEILTSMPGVGARTAIELLRTVGAAPPSPARPTSPLTPASLRQPDSLDALSRASTRPTAVTGPSKAPSTCPRSPASSTHQAGSTTTANEPKASPTRPR